MTNSLSAATNVRPVELNERAIKAAAPGDILRDATIAGLHLRAFPSKKTFYLYFRTKAGKERRPKLGDYGSITLTQARAAAQKMLAEVALGKDPIAVRAELKNEPTVADLWARFDKDRASKKKSAKEMKRVWPVVLEPLFGKKRLSEITYASVTKMMENMADTPIQANRALAQLSSMFGFALAPLQWVEKNPCHKVTRYPENKRKRYATGEEVAAIARELEVRRADSPASVAFIYLLILTGARKGEIGGAKWDWLDGNVLRLPDSKTGAKSVYLPEKAMEILSALPRTTGTLTGIKSPQKLWESVRVAANCPDMHLHDLRHSFASAALAAGIPLDQIGELLGHKSAQTTKRYAHLVEEAAAKAAAATGDRIAGMFIPK